MPKNTSPTAKPLPDWDLILSSAARLQRIFPDAVLVGGTVSAIHAKRRFSRDADHILTDLRERFDDVLAELESVAGWVTAKVQRPVLIPGSLDGIETGIRQLIRDKPLETVVLDYHGEKLTVPTEAEILRIKGVLILKRNATRDYLDFVALARHVGDAGVVTALRSFARFTHKKMANLPYSSCRCSLPTRYPTTWKKPSFLNTKIWMRSGMTGTLSRLFAPIYRPLFLIVSAILTVANTKHVR